MERWNAVFAGWRRAQEAAGWAADESWVRCRNYERDAAYMECVRDILEHPVFNSMDQYIQHGNTTCRTHCIQVSYLAYRICRRYGGNARSAARAGLLHDLFLYDWHTHARETGEHFHGFTHPKRALKMRNAILNSRRKNGELSCIICGRSLLCRLRARRALPLSGRINSAAHRRRLRGFGICACSACCSRPGVRTCAFMTRENEF